jgi:hypothetical protein
MKRGSTLCGAVSFNLAVHVPRENPAVSEYIA